MNTSFLAATWEASIKSNLALAIANVVLVIITAAAVFHSYSIKETVVLSPMRVDEQMEIGWDSANEPYLKSFGLFAATLVANLTPNNAAFVADSMSQFVETSLYAEIRKAILSTAETRIFKEAAGSTKFEATAVIFEPNSNKVFVMGTSTLYSSIGNHQPRPVTYEMTVRIVARRPIIYSFESYDGTVPHTADWLKAQPQEDKNQ